MKPIVRGARRALLAVVAGLASASPALAEECCSHLGGSVQCPGTLPAGSRSLQFQEGGTFWQLPGGAAVFVPQTVFPACTSTTSRPAPAGSSPTTTSPTTTSPTTSPSPSTSPARPPEAVIPDRGRAAQDRARGLIDGRPVIVVPVPPAAGQPPSDVDDRIRRLGKEIQQRYHTVPREPEGVAPPAEEGSAKAPPPEKPAQTTERPAECRLDLAVHRPISQDPSQPRVPKERQFRHGAFTLRNDDADAPVGPIGDGGHALPVTTLRDTDLKAEPNPLENDLVRIRATNPRGLKNVHLFAFTLEAEADRILTSEVVRTARPAPQANVAQLATWTDASKSAAGPVFAAPVDGKGLDFWVEGRLGGRYVFALGVVPDQANPQRFRYHVEDRPRTSKAEPFGPGKPVIPEQKDQPAVELGCLEQASLTVVVVDIFQKSGKTVRENAFDVYWSGRPLFKAMVWPAGGKYDWAAKYRRGALEAANEPPGTPLTGRAGAMPAGPPPPDGGSSESLARGKEIEGVGVTASGIAKGTAGTPGTKVEIQGGLVVDARRKGKGDQAGPGADADSLTAESRPDVEPDAKDPYPHRISVAYTLNAGTADAETLVRAEPLAIILPQLAAIPVGQKVVTSPPPIGPYEVRSQVHYTISDGFKRPITAPSVPEYLQLYGAGLMAWEALWVEGGYATERGDRISIDLSEEDLKQRRKQEDEEVARQRRELETLERKGRRMSPEAKERLHEKQARDREAREQAFEARRGFRVETAQRTQARLHRDRMTLGAFQDTLRVTLGEHRNVAVNYWQYWSKHPTTLARNDYIVGSVNEWKEDRRRSQGDAIRRDELDREDDRSAKNNLLFQVRQDVVLQLRTEAALHDLRVLRRNRVRVYFPQFFPDWFVPDEPEKRWLSHVWLAFEPGTDTEPVLLPPDFLVGKGERPSSRD